jgi:hypothetical protein
VIDINKPPADVASISCALNSLSVNSFTMPTPVAIYHPAYGIINIQTIDDMIAPYIK